MPSRVPEVFTSNGVRVFLESGGDELFRFGCPTLPVKDDEIVYTPLGEDPVTYTVEKAVFCVMEQPETVNSGPNPDNLDPYVSYVKVEVSIV